MYIEVQEYRPEHTVENDACFLNSSETSSSHEDDHELFDDASQDQQ